MAERMLTIVAGLLLLVGAVLLWRDNLTAAFITAILGVVAWFLSFRAQSRARQALESPVESDEDLEE